MKKNLEEYKMSLNKILNNKGITAVIIICLILLVAVTAIAGYNTWFNDYISAQYANAESQDTNIALIHDVIGPTLYLSNPYNENITILRVTIEGINCEVNVNATPGMNEVDVMRCAHKIVEPAVEVVVYTGKHVYSKFVFVDRYKIPQGAILGGSDCSLLYDIENDMDGDYFLTGNLNCFDTKDWNNGTGFDPIGNESASFTGTLNGNGFTIYNLYMNHSDKETGMFGSLNGAVIKNLNFDLLNITGLKKSSGALAGFGQNSTIVNVRVKGDITGERKSVGGIIGELQNSIMIRCSYEQGIVSGDRKSVGGLVGLLENSEIHNSFSTGNVTGIREASGGLVGQSKTSLVNCSYSAGIVLSSQGSEGGLIGDELSATTIDSYWDIDTSGQSASYGGIGFSTALMQSASTYSSWDNNVWNIENGSYPKLR